MIVLKVLAENVSTAEAAKRCGISASTIQPYVTKARSCLEQSAVALTRVKKPVSKAFHFTDSKSAMWVVSESKKKYGERFVL